MLIKKKLLLVITLFLIPLATGCESLIATSPTSTTPSGFTLDGTTVDLVTAGASGDFVITLDSDSNSTNGSLQTINSGTNTAAQVFMFTALSNGTYFVRGFKDLNSNLTLETGEVYSTVDLMGVITGADLSIGTTLKFNATFP